MRLDVDKVTLRSGAHSSPSEGLCVMEAVAYIAREKHSDQPECVSPVIGAFMRSWNDALSDADRQKLKPLIPIVMDTRSTPEDENRRAWMALDWLVREHTPVWLRLAGLTEHADTLAALPRFKAGMDVPSIRPAIEAARRDAAAAWAAARAAAGAAARDAVRDAAWAAAWDAAGAAARDAVRDAARDAVRDAAWDAAGDAAWAAAGDAAGAAARDAAWDAAWDAAGDAAWAAAGAAARDVLRPTVEHLQDFALHLVEAMAWLKDED